MNRHFRTLTRAIDGKEAQAGNVDIEKMMVGITDQFSGLFRGGVGRNRTVDVIGFSKGDFGIVAIDGRGRGKEYFTDIMVTTGVE